MMLKSYTWDYYPEHTDQFQQALCPSDTVRFLWHPSLRRTTPLPSLTQQDIDILFVGALTDRRERIVKDLEHKTGLKVTVAMNVWGQQLDDMIDRSKVILNLTGNDSEVRSFEVVRCMPIVAKNKLVIAENYHYIGIYPEAKGFVLFTDLDQLAETCLYYVQHPIERQALADQHTQRLEQTNITQELDRAIKRYFEHLSSKATPALPPIKTHIDRLGIINERPFVWRYDTSYIYFDDAISNQAIYTLQHKADFALPLRDHTHQFNLSRLYRHAAIAPNSLLDINASDYLARTDSPVEFMRWCFEMLQLGGTVTMNLPYYLHDDSYQNPPYVRVCSSSSLKPFIGKDSTVFQNQITEPHAYFKLVRTSYVPTALGHVLYDKTERFDDMLGTRNAVQNVLFTLMKTIDT